MYKLDFSEESIRKLFENHILPSIEDFEKILPLVNKEVAEYLGCG